MEGRKIFFEKTGRGASVVWVHGWGGSGESLRKLHDKASESFSSLVLDLPGFGRSDNPDPDWGVPEYAKLLVDLLSSEMKLPVNYFGHSFGASLGIYIAANFPGVIGRLVVCSASFSRKPKRSPLARIVNKVIPNYQEIKKSIAPLRLFAYKVLYRGSDALRRTDLEENFRRIVQEDLARQARKVKIPTLILWGMQDRETPVENAYDLNKLIKGSEMKIFDGYRHGLPLTAPELVYSEVLKFITQPES